MAASKRQIGVGIVSAMIVLLGFIAFVIDESPASAAATDSSGIEQGEDEAKVSGAADGTVSSDRDLSPVAGSPEAGSDRRPYSNPQWADVLPEGVDPSEATCVECHSTVNPGMHQQWLESAHGREDVTCIDCHQAEDSDVDGFEHYGNTRISIIVTPKDCAECHEQQVNETFGSHHAKGGQILASLDNLLGEVLGGPAAVNAGCRQCHGSEVEIGPDGRPTLETWPNTGIGRINPDGSLGSCTACHGRHAFSVAQARTPDTCGKCHVGPDHPQKEVYEESKHGIIYFANIEDMNLDHPEWVSGVDYVASATCSTCHMSAAPGLPATHDVGERISWTLRPPISTKLNMVKLANGQKHDIHGEDPDLPAVGDVYHGSEVIEVLTWQDRRNKMRTVCRSCHSQGMVDGHYKQFDDVVHLYNDKFARPISALMDDLKERGLITKTPFDDKIEWIWWEIWHHEGRRARHGASMNGPDYTWWHGIYEVAKHTYFALIPELKRIAGEELANELLEKHLRPIAGHEWYFSGLSMEALESVRRGYERRYGEGAFK